MESKSCSSNGAVAMYVFCCFFFALVVHSCFWGSARCASIQTNRQLNCLFADGCTLDTRLLTRCRPTFGLQLPKWDSRLSKNTSIRMPVPFSARSLAPVFLFYSYASLFGISYHCLSTFFRLWASRDWKKNVVIIPKNSLNQIPETWME